MLHVTIHDICVCTCYLRGRCCNAVPDKPIISDVVSGDSYMVVTWQMTSADDANPGHTFYIRYRHTGDHIMLQVSRYVTGGHILSHVVTFCHKWSHFVTGGHIMSQVISGVLG